MSNNALKPFRISSVIVEEGRDDTAEMYVYAAPFPSRDGARVCVFEFITDIKGRQSARLTAFLAACRAPSQLNQSDELEGRLFAVRGRGSSASDFVDIDFAFTPTFACAA